MNEEQRISREVELPKWMWDALDGAPNYGIPNAEAMIEKAVQMLLNHLRDTEADRQAWEAEHGPVN